MPIAVTSTTLPLQRELQPTNAASSPAKSTKASQTRPPHFAAFSISATANVRTLTGERRARLLQPAANRGGRRNFLLPRIGWTSVGLHSPFVPPNPRSEHTTPGSTNLSSADHCPDNRSQLADEALAENRGELGFASGHSRGGIFDPQTAWRKTKKMTFVAASSLGTSARSVFARSTMQGRSWRYRRLAETI